MNVLHKRISLAGLF